MADDACAEAPWFRTLQHMVQLDSESARAGDEIRGTSDRTTVIGVDLVRVERTPGRKWLEIRPSSLR